MEAVGVMADIGPVHNSKIDQKSIVGDLTVAACGCGWLFCEQGSKGRL